VNAFLLDHQGAAGPATLTEANALSSVAGLLGPLAVGAGAATVLGWRAGLLVAGAGLILVEVWRGRRVGEFGRAGSAAHAEHRSQPLPRRIYWTFALIMCFLGTEFSMVYWSADLLRERAGFGPAAAAAALATVTGGMAVGRYTGSRLARTISGERLLRISVVIALVGFALTWAPTMGAVILVGMCVTGLGLGVQWPLGVSRAVGASGGMTDRAAALCSVFGSVAIASAPFMLGALSDRIGFHAAFLIVPLLLATALVILLLRPARVSAG
jgi:fucose permease